MVIYKDGCLSNPCIREITFISMPTVGRISKSTSRRIPELPSLRYGPVGAKTTTSGPLRVTSNYQCETIRRNSSKKSNMHSFATDDISFKSIRPPRHVRFTLPTADGNGSMRVGVGGESGVKSATPVAGDSWLRTRAGGTLSQRSTTQRNRTNFITETQRTYADLRRDLHHSSAVIVPVTASPGARSRVHPTGRYVRGTLSPTSNASAPAAASPAGQVLLRAARDGDEAVLKEVLRRAHLVGVPQADINATDSSGRSVLSYIVSNGTQEILEQILCLPGLDINRPDNEGNTPLHFAAQAGQVECLNCLLTKCRSVEMDARNNLGFTPLMKAALQGRNKCAKLLLTAGANPTLRDNGRGLRADQWARFCGRYVCADVIEKHARQRLLERSTSYGNWGVENEMSSRIIMGRVMPVPQMTPLPQQSNGIKSKLRKVFRTSSGPGHNGDNLSSVRLVTQLTSAALCASTPVLPSGSTVPPVVKSLIRPLTVPRLQITLANGEHPLTHSNGIPRTQNNNEEKNEKAPVIKPARNRKKK